MEKVVLGRYKGIVVSSDMDERQREEAIMQALIESSAVRVDEDLVNERARRMAEEYALRLVQQGLSIEQYYEQSGTDERALINRMRKLSRRQIKGRFLLEEIAAKEHLTASDEEFEQEIEKMTQRYPLRRDQIREIIRGQEEERLRKEIIVKKALDFVKDHTVEKP